SASPVLNSVLVKKFTWSAPSEGTARMSRNNAINAIEPTMIAAAATASDLKTCSARRPCPPPCGLSGDLFGSLGMDAVSPALRRLAPVDEPAEATSGLTVIFALSGD